MPAPEVGDRLEWTRTLSPTTEPGKLRLSEHSAVEAWHVEVRFRPWILPAGEPTPSREDTYGWKPQVEPEFTTPSRSIGEVELAQRMRAADYMAYWVDTWGSAPAIWRTWARRPNELPRLVADMDRTVRQHPLMLRWKKGGVPDVVAIEQETGALRFVEYKGPSAANPRKQDSINEKQDSWFRAALDTGLLNPDNYVVAKWVPDHSSRTLLDEQVGWRKPTFRAPAV